VATRAYVSIGEVLEQLRDEFPDVTISKIRFLESQGLVEPERAPSGYRRFDASDIERLRFVLRLQREQFLPLKVIKERLDEADRDGTLGSTVDPPQLDLPADAETRSRGRRPAKEPVLFEETRRAREQAEARAVAGVVADEAGPDDLNAAMSGVSLTRTELAKAAKLSDEDLGSLEEFGIIVPSSAGDRVLFDEDALAAARVAALFMQHGIEPRHLRMYRAFADREAALFEQVLLPYRRQRNPEAQARTAEALAELAGLGRQLRTVMLRQTVRRSLGG
jgi:DNA-binding transcriptional MerR regulator